MDAWKAHLRRAIRLAGSQPKLAEAMRSKGGVDCSQSKISWLLTTAKNISAEDALAIHRAVDGEVLASELRPDLWPTEQHVPIEREPEQAAS